MMPAADAGTGRPDGTLSGALAADRASYLPALMLNAGVPEPTADPRLVGQLGGMLTAGALRGDQLVLGVGPRLVVVALGGSVGPRVVGRSVVLPCPPLEIALVGSFALAAMGSFGTAVFDLADAAEPRLVEWWAGSVGAGSLAVQGERAFVADSVDGFWVAEIDTDGRLHRRLRRATGGRVSWLTVDGAVLYTGVAVAVNHRLQLQLYQLDRQPAPVMLARGEATAGAWPPDYRWVITSGVGYLQRGNGGLVMVDFRTSTIPETVRLALTDGPQLIPLAADGARLLAWSDDVDGMDGLVLLDLAQPFAPRVMGRIEAQRPGLTLLAGSTGVLIGRSVRLIDLAAPDWTVTGVPGLVEHADLVRLGPGELLAVGVDGADWLHVEDPAKPRVAPLLDGWPWGRPWASDGRIVVARPADGAGDRLVLIDATDPARPQQVAVVGTSSPGIWGVALRNGYVVVGTDDHLEVIDASDPGAPLLRSSWALPDRRESQAMVVADGWLYLAVGAQIQVFSMGARGQLRLVGGVTLDQPVQALALDGEVLVAIASPNVLQFPINTTPPPDTVSRLQVLDVSDPAAPRRLGALAVDAWPRAVALIGRRAYVARVDAPHEVLVVDLADPAAPRISGTATMALFDWGHLSGALYCSGRTVTCEREIPAEPPWAATVDDAVLWLSRPDGGLWAYR